MLKRFKEEWPVIVIYKELEFVEKGGESAARGKRPIVEQTVYVTAAPLVLRPTQRLFFTTTTVAANAIQMADVPNPADLPKVPQEVKAAIHSMSGMPRHERDMPKKKLLTLCTHDKSTRLIREHLHAIRPQRAITTTPGSGPLLKACITQEVKLLIFYKSKELFDHLVAYGQAHILHEAKTNIKSTFYLARDKIIKRLGLPPDGGNVNDDADVEIHSSDGDSDQLPALQQESEPPLTDIVKTSESGSVTQEVEAAIPGPSYEAGTASHVASTEPQSDDIGAPKLKKPRKQENLFLASASESDEDGESDGIDGQPHDDDVFKQLFKVDKGKCKARTKKGKGKKTGENIPKASKEKTEPKAKPKKPKVDAKAKAMNKT